LNYSDVYPFDSIENTNNPNKKLMIIDHITYHDIKSYDIEKKKVLRESEIDIEHLELPKLRKKSSKLNSLFR